MFLKITPNNNTIKFLAFSCFIAVCAFVACTKRKNDPTPVVNVTPAPTPSPTQTPAQTCKPARWLYSYYDSGPSNIVKTTSFTYNAEGLVENETDTVINNNTKSFKYTQRYTYLNGRVLSEDYNSVAYNGARGSVRTEYSYSGNNLIKVKFTDNLNLSKLTITFNHTSDTTAIKIVTDSSYQWIISDTSILSLSRQGYILKDSGKYINYYYERDAQNRVIIYQSKGINDVAIKTIRKLEYATLPNKLITAHESAYLPITKLWEPPVRSTPITQFRNAIINSGLSKTIDFKNNDSFISENANALNSSSCVDKISSHSDNNSLHYDIKSYIKYVY